MPTYLTLHFIIYVVSILITIAYIINNNEELEKLCAFILLIIECSILYWTYQLILTYGSIFSKIFN